LIDLFIYSCIDDIDVGKLWTAPEILRENNPPRRGTQRADVYSYAIVCYEIMMRTEPYNFDNITPRGTVGLHSVKSPCVNAQNPLYQIPRSFPVDGEVSNLLRTCYGEATGKLL